MTPRAIELAAEETTKPLDDAGWCYSGMHASPGLRRGYLERVEQFAFRVELREQNIGSNLDSLLERYRTGYDG